MGYLNWIFVLFISQYYKIWKRSIFVVWKLNQSEMFAILAQRTPISTCKRPKAYERKPNKRVLCSDIVEFRNFATVNVHADVEK